MDLNTLRTSLGVSFLCIGTVGNILSFITVTSKHCKKSSYAVYIAALSIADFWTLYMTVLYVFAQPGTFGSNLVTTSPIFCKLHFMLFAFFSGVSIWLVVILASERAVVTYFPFKAKSVCKPKTALITTALLTTIHLAFSSHYVYGMQIQSAVSPNTAPLKPTPESKSPINFERNDSVSLPPFEEMVSGSFNDDYEHGDYNNSSNSDDILHLCEEGAVGNKTLGTELEHGASDRLLALGCNLTVIKSDNYSVSPSDCFQFNNITSSRLIGNGNADDENSDYPNGDAHVASGNDSDVTNTQSGAEPILSKSNNASGLQADEPTTSPPDVLKDNRTKDIGTDENTAADMLDNTHQTGSTPMTLDQEDDYFVTTFCGFVDQGYAAFYRFWVPVESTVYFWAPVTIINTTNTATWIKVQRSSSKSVMNMAAQRLRRTRHVLILTTLISIGFTVFVTPITMVFLLEAILADDFKYPVSNQKAWAVFQVISDCLYLGNHSFNFFLYIFSGQRYRNTFKSVFCKQTAGRPSFE